MAIAVPVALIYGWWLKRAAKNYLSISEWEPRD